MLTASRLRELLVYEPDTGIFRRRTDVICGNKRVRLKAGDIAGGKTKKGYIHITVDGHRAYAHRLAWLYVHGEWPAQHIDHINGDVSDNRISNLRPATPQENQWNSKKPRTNTTGFKGVTRVKSSGRYIAQIHYANGSKYLGSFLTAEEAHQAYAEASARLHGHYGRLA